MNSLRDFINEAREPEPREADLLIKFNNAAAEVAALREELNDAVRRRESARTNLDQHRRRQEIGAKADRAWKRWTAAEIEVLHDSSMTTAEMAVELGRSWDSVKLKRSRLGIANG